jgi:HD superfamily phosphodiesterase
MGEMQKKKYRLTDFHKTGAEQLASAMRNVFCKTLWLEPFLNSKHHGIEHGDMVRLGALKLIEQLTPEERAALIKEGEEIDSENPLASASAIAEIASFLHDCGRYDDNGDFLVEKQINHPFISAERAATFCMAFGFSNALKFMEDAVKSHDFHSKTHTPYYTAPKTMIGRLVQSSDQMGWFHPGAIKRTIAFSRDCERQFFDRKIPIQERTKFNSPLSYDNCDVVTVLLVQLYGYCGEERLGIAAARKKVEKYKKELREEIIQLAQEKGVGEEVREIIERCEEVIY